MKHLRLPTTAAVASLLLAAHPLPAQIDYRNLDEGRPVSTEDAYPVERYAFELVVPYEYEREAGGGSSHLVSPELALGFLPNAMIGLKLPAAAVDAGGATGTEWGLAGPRLFALFNTNTEGRSLPAFALRADAAFPVGRLAGDVVRVGLTAIATRSWGRTRAHINGTLGLGPRAETVHGVPSWAASAAIDRTLLRQSMLLIGELSARRATAGAATEVSAALGGRRQITPTLVIDAGISRRLTDDAGPDVRFTVGLTHAFALAGLMPSGGE